MKYGIPLRLGLRKSCLNLITLIKQRSRALEMSGRDSINRNLMIRSSAEYLVCISVYFLGMHCRITRRGLTWVAARGAGLSRCYLEFGLLNCIDPSTDALSVAKRNLSGYTNVRFFQATTETVPLRAESQDFGYSLGVLHHVPDTQSAMDSCVKLLKPGAPFLVYLYYNFDNRPVWFVLIWRASERVRRVISIMPPILKNLATDLIALTVYWPLAKLSWLGEKIRLNTQCMPLHAYRDCSFYTMRTDARDRFGTPVEKRFTRSEINIIMKRSGLDNIVISDT